MELIKFIDIDTFKKYTGDTNDDLDDAEIGKYITDASIRILNDANQGDLFTD